MPCERHGHTFFLQDWRRHAGPGTIGYAAAVREPPSPERGTSGSGAGTTVRDLIMECADARQ